MIVDFTGKSAIVTGAAHGIGRAIVHGLARRGARVLACDIREPELLETVQGGMDNAPDGAAGAITARLADASDRQALGALVAEAESLSRNGHVDIAVHAAGGVLGQVSQALEDITPEQWRAILDINITGAFYLAQAAAPAMKRAGRGRIVVISSRAAFNTSLTGIHSYAAAKAGQLGLIRQLALELGPSGVTVNGVAPGFMRTNPDSERQWVSYGAEGQRQMLERLSIKRLGRPEDIAHMVMFLASDYADWITGQIVQVTGSP